MAASRYGGDEEREAHSQDMICSDPSAIPEPMTLALFGIGLLGLLAIARKKRKIKG
jgi:hypothetical protein